ncbi:MAG: YggS family pyridoxal phosphate-dependent enzyme [Candidatus Omnitrophota bacterium]
MIKENIKNILQQLPVGVELVVAAKGRGIAEVEEVISSGANIIGENYVQEAAKKFAVIGRKARWHCIGHLQRNKVKLAVQIFDVIETLDSFELAVLLDNECKKINKIMSVLLEVNSGDEKQKNGITFEALDDFIAKVTPLSHIKAMGLMTMGPLVSNPEAMRPFFRKTKETFLKIKNGCSQPADWKYLSMGMSDTYRIAIEEGANIVRIGTAIFGPRAKV